MEGGELQRLTICPRLVPRSSGHSIAPTYQTSHITFLHCQRYTNLATTTMLQRSTRRLLPALNRRASAVRTYSTQTDNPVPANNPNPKERNSPVSGTNALPTVAMGGQDQALVEDPFDGEQKRVMQAPNRADVWSRSQQPRSKAMVGPRFEQSIMEDQVRNIWEHISGGDKKDGKVVKDNG